MSEKVLVSRERIATKILADCDEIFGAAEMTPDQITKLHNDTEGVREYMTDLTLYLLETLDGACRRKR